MKKLLVFLCAAILLISGCIDQKTINNSTVKSGTVKNGSTVSIDYVASIEGGKIFDTTIESVAKQNNISVKNKKYQPISFKVGEGKFFKGFDEGVIGMKVGDTKTLVLTPENGYGPIDPNKISVIPIIQSVPVKSNISKTIETPVSKFNQVFGNHSVGDIVKIPDSNVNLTVKSIGTNVTLVFLLNVGDKISQKGAPWSQTVIAVDNNNITIKPDAKENETVILPEALWNSTVIGINNTDITLRHNPIPVEEITTTFGSFRVNFNETSIIVDRNNKFAGKTIKFDITLKSIN